MSDGIPFRLRFPRDVAPEGARKDFLFRLRAFVAPELDDEFGHFLSRNSVMADLSFKLAREFSSDRLPDVFGKLDLRESLQAFEICYAHVRRIEKTKFDGQIEGLLAEAETDLGFRWEDGQFWPSGSPILDSALVDDLLEVLSGSEWQSVLGPFKRGLEAWLAGGSKPDERRNAVRDMYESLEALCQKVLQNNKRLHENREEMCKVLRLDSRFKDILKYFFEYLSDYRHAPRAAQQKPPPGPVETEAAVYMAGLILRMCVMSLESAPTEGRREG